MNFQGDRLIFNPIDWGPGEYETPDSVDLSRGSTYDIRVEDGCLSVYERAGQLGYGRQLRNQHPHWLPPVVNRYRFRLRDSNDADAQIMFSDEIDPPRLHAMSRSDTTAIVMGVDYRNRPFCIAPPGNPRGYPTTVHMGGINILGFFDVEELMQLYTARLNQLKKKPREKQRFLQKIIRPEEIYIDGVRIDV